MRAVQVLAPGHAEFVEVPTPELKPGHALVRPLRVSLCGSDIYMLHHAPKHLYPFPPGTTGHEMVGVVEAVDAPGSGIEPGMVALTLAPRHQAMAEYYLAHIDHVIPLPPGKSIEELLQAQQLGTVLYACKHLTTNVIGKDVAVIGQGSAGLWFDWMMRRLGARRVIGIDLQPHRLMLPKSYGATHTVNNSQIDAAEAVAEITNGHMVDLVVEAAGERETLIMTSSLIKEQGEILLFGIPHYQEITMNWFDMFRKYPRIKAISGATNDPGQGVTRHAVELIADGEIDVKPILTHSFPFERVMEAYELQRTRDEGAVKIVVEMSEMR
ncbi:MAG: zinc-binding dehydrogenase [Caldilineaceae bacterium]|nr:zinc-binding dehydrogenase [Caldilineaceae bacterium]